MLLKIKSGTHYNNGKLLQVGDSFESRQPLHVGFPDKFELLSRVSSGSSTDDSLPPMEELPRRFRDIDKTPLVIGYWTEHSPYANEAYVLSKTLDTQGLGYDLRAVSNLGSWQKNTQYKPTFIRQMMNEYPGRALLYLDVDCLVLKPPKTIMDLHNTVDFAVNITEHNRALHSGTLYFGPTEGAVRLVDEWIVECEKYPVTLPNGKPAWDQRVLQRVVERSGWLKWKILPVAYCYIIELSQRYAPKTNPILLHTRGALRFKRQMDGKAGFEL